MYITNDVRVALIAEKAGVDWIFIDLEQLGKAERQRGMDSVQSIHSLSDVQNISSVLKRSKVLVRINPMHQANRLYCSSEEEIETALLLGAQLIMLPYFKTTIEVQEFIKCVNGRASTIILVETLEAVCNLNDILAIDGIDAVHIGLNDLSLALGKRFMFELLADGTIEALCKVIRQYDIPYGFGGIASINKGIVPAEMIISEHYRLGSSAAILSRSFCNMAENADFELIESIFLKGVAEIRTFEDSLLDRDEIYFEQNRLQMIQRVKYLVNNIL